MDLKKLISSVILYVFEMNEHESEGGRRIERSGHGDIINSSI